MASSPTNRREDKKARPCDACRRRKSKCVTEAGNTFCVLCKFHGQDCTYLDEPQPRKRKVDAEGVSASTVSVRKPKRSKHFRTTSGVGIEEYDDLEGPTLLKRTLGLQNLHHSRYIALNDLPELHARALSPETASKGQAHPSRLETIRFVDQDVAFRIIPDQGTEDHETHCARIDEIEETVSTYGPDLVHLYFRIVHPSFPILHKEVYLEKYSRSFREFSPPLLAAVYLLACGYWTYSDKLATSPKPDVEKLRRLAFASLRCAFHRQKLSTIQAGLLLSQYQYADSDGGLMVFDNGLTAQLVSLSYGLGLHLDASTWDIPDWEVGLRRRLAFAVMMQDKWTALLTGQPSLIHADDWAVTSLTDADFPEHVEDEEEGSSEVQKGRLVFMHMVSLTMLMSDIIKEAFSVRSQTALRTSSNPLALLLDTVKPLQIRLRDWSMRLPDLLKMDTAASMKLSSVGYLRLAYLAVEVSLHKRIANVVNREAGAANELTRICRSAARERFVNAVDFVQGLRAQHLASFWYFPSAQICTLVYGFGQALQAHSVDSEEAAFYDSRLREYKWALRVNSEAGSKFSKTALSLINSPAPVVDRNRQHSWQSAGSATATPLADWEMASLAPHDPWTQSSSGTGLNSLDFSQDPRWSSDFGNNMVSDIGHLDMGSRQFLQQYPTQATYGYENHGVPLDYS